MKISVIIPNYNDKRISASIKSIINQTCKHYELIIIDGGSTDIETLNIYDNYKTKISILIIEKDNGIFDALNKGIQKSSGEVIFLLGADDYLSDNGIFEDIKQIFEFDKKLDGVCINCSYQGRQKRIIRQWEPAEISSKNILKGILPPHFSLFLRKELYDINGMFPIVNNELGLDSIWLISLAQKKDLNIINFKNHSLIMSYGGKSTGSFKRIVNANFNIYRYLTKHRVSNFHALIIILRKTISKIFQFNVFLICKRKHF